MKLLRYSPLLLLSFFALELALAGCAKPYEMNMSEQGVVEQETGITVDQEAEPEREQVSEQKAEQETKTTVEPAATDKTQANRTKPVEEAAVAVDRPEPAAAEKAAPGPPEITIEQLTERLKETEAIGFLTKLAIRSDVLDFRQSVESYRKRGSFEANAEKLRGYFNGLLLKILALLERDPALSRDIYLARESIWKSLVEAKS
ncbi:MAG: hypothetical protein K9M17_06450 [Mariprofundaceae bacterium]|nr:hypothetical protein [Mariprofundaceae bacterium]